MLRLLGGVLLVGGLIGGAPGPAFAQETEDAEAETTQLADPPCSEPSPCPETDTTKNPEITCFEPRSAPKAKGTTLHIYGRHLAQPDTPPGRFIYRDEEEDFGSRGDAEVEVKSTCHLTATLYKFGNPGMTPGDSVEFRLLREFPSDEAREEGSKGTVSDWHYLKIAKP